MNLKKTLSKLTISFVIIFLLILFLTSLSNDSYAQFNQPEFFVDHAQFRYDEDFVYFQLSYSILKRSLIYEKSGDSLTAKGVIKTFLIEDWNIPDTLFHFDNETGEIKTKDGSSFEYKMSDSLLIEDAIYSVEEIFPRKKIVDVCKMKISPGYYQLYSVFIDLNSGQFSEVKDYIEISPFDDNKLSLSDIELASLIKTADNDTSKFYKNDLFVIPNPDRVYGAAFPELYFYVEIYHQTKNGKSAEVLYRLDGRILNQFGKSVSIFKPKVIKEIPPSSAMDGSYNIVQLPGGFYTLEIKVTCVTTKEVAVAKKNFVIYGDGL